MAKISLDRNRSKGTISRYIYGSFAEHLGRCMIFQKSLGWTKK